MKRVPTYIHLFPAAILVLGIAACITSSALAGLDGEFMGLLLLVCITCLLLGGVLGFLFGIPRLNKTYNPEDANDRNTKYRPNTNLEEVSDWLTKIIIGVGLTQLGRIPEHLRTIAGSILSDVDCSRVNCDFARPLLVAAILYFLIAGFIIGYFYTRLFLPNLFSIMEENRVKDAEIALWRSGIKEHTKQGEHLPPQEKETEFNRWPLTDEERQILNTIKQLGEQRVELKSLSPGERAAVNVLVAKGVLEWDPGDAIHEGITARVIDNKLFNKLINESCDRQK